MKIFLCGDTGRLNRGCEAIVRGTHTVFEELGNKNEIILATFAADQNRPMVREMGISMIPYSTYPSKIHRIVFAGVRRVFRRSLAGYGYVQRPLFKRMSQGDICLNIGGDTYCYTRPAISLALNKHTHKNKIKNILWCCSIEKNKIQGEIRNDLNRYSYIFAREAITVRNLIDMGIPQNKVIKVCDPAFFLNKKEISLPEGFIPGNTVGINLSDCVIYGKYRAAYDNAKRLINWLLENTDMPICLVPHVYNVNDEYNHDYPILKRLHKEINNSRVLLVDKEYDCEELKYIISNCRFFVGARTHSTIAAYSTGIPTLVIGYSVKSKGIATDLFGTYEDYVLPFEELTDDDQLLNAFKRLMFNEEMIKQLYAETLPAYKKQLTDAIEKYILCNESNRDKNIICDRDLCTGCSACAEACPRKCIEMVGDKEGFLYPEIKQSNCVDCGNCVNVCPIVNRYKDDNKQPISYGAKNNNIDERMGSSSGGIFSIMARTIIDNGGVVHAPMFDEKYNLTHAKISDIKEIGAAMGSKYVQSDVGGCYGEIKQLLEEGRSVLFSGTPCQIGGLCSYLKKDYANLFLQDIVCHGVPSPIKWQEYLQYRIKKTGGAKINKLWFRKKEGPETVTKIIFDNNAEYSNKYGDDPFIKSYLSNMNMRPSCYDCSFKHVHRLADITLADFWGVERVAPDLKDANGVSLVMIHSEKGRKMLESISDSLTICAVDFQKAIADNSSYFISTPRSPMRKLFFKKARAKNFEKIVERYCGNGLMAKARRKLNKMREG